MRWFELNEQAKAFCFTHDQAMCEESEIEFYLLSFETKIWGLIF